MPNCEICKVYISQGNLCERCSLNLFQITEILDTYIHENPAPNWLLNGIRELSWMFMAYPRTMAFFNTAMEVTEIFIIDREDKISVDELMEVNYTQLPRDKVLSLLEEAYIIERTGNDVFPGKLVKKLQQVRWEGYQMDTPQIESKLLELHGILTVAITRSLIRDREYLPRRALAILSLLSLHMIASGEEIGNIIDDYTVDLAFAGLGTRQQNRIMRIMAGFFDGKTKIISDITDDGKKETKPQMIEYMSHIRERYRERGRERQRI